MYLIDPDILNQARGLSPVFSAAGILLGLLLWLTGWHWHRFWVVLAVTLAGGLIGLQQAGKTSAVMVLAFGLLLSVSAGLMAFEIARLGSYVAAGSLAWLTAGILFPRVTEVQWLAFFSGGLIGVYLFRFWMMLATSWLGVVLSWHSIHILVETLFKVDAAAFARRNSLVLDGGIAAATVLGMLTQAFLDRWYTRRKARHKKNADEAKKAAEKAKILASVAPKPAPKSMLKRLLGFIKK